MEKNVFSEEINLEFFIFWENTALFEFYSGFLIPNSAFRINLSFDLNQVSALSFCVDGIQVTVGVPHGGYLLLQFCKLSAQ